MTILLKMVWCKRGEGGREGGREQEREREKERQGRRRWVDLVLVRAYGVMYDHTVQNGRERGREGGGGWIWVV